MIDFTKLLPSMKSGQELISALSIIPKYDESICEQDQTVRLVALSDLYQIYIPSRDMRTIKQYSNNLIVGFWAVLIHLRLSEHLALGNLLLSVDPFL